MRALYAIALGSNQRHAHFGSPHNLIEEALRRLPGVLLDRSRIITSRPIGPSIRSYANAAALIETEMDPPDLLAALHAVEAELGRIRRGRRWRARTIDLDIILWSDGVWSEPDLSVPHPAFRQRHFVLEPLSQIAAGWRDPLSTRTIGQLLAQCTRRIPALDPPLPRA